MRYRVILDTYRGEHGEHIPTFITCKARDKTEAGRRAWQEMVKRSAEVMAEVAALVRAMPGEKIVAVWKYQGLWDTAWVFGQRVRNVWREWERWRPHTIDIDAAAPVDEEDDEEGGGV